MTFLIGGGVVVAGLTILFILLGFTWWMAIINGLVMMAYFSYFLLHFLYFSRKWNAIYHFYAKIDNFEKREIVGEITKVSDTKETMEGISFFEIEVDGQCIYVEEPFMGPDFEIGRKIHLYVMERYVIAYEEVGE